MKTKHAGYQYSRANYVQWLNEVGCPSEDRKCEGGRVPDDADYGEWLRRNDPVAFNVGFNEWSRE